MREAPRNRNGRRAMRDVEALAAKQAAQKEARMQQRTNERMLFMQNHSLPAVDESLSEIDSWAMQSVRVSNGSENNSVSDSEEELKNDRFQD